MAESRNRDDFCYRHPKTESFVLCQRCGNTICPECQVQAAVGFHCPDCAGVKKSGSLGGLFRRGSTRSVAVGTRPSATYVLLGIIVAVYAGQLLSGGLLTQLLLYWPPLTAIEPWRMVTTMFVHSQSSIFHILFNGYSLFILGTLVERLIGPGRFVTLFLFSGFGGSVLVSLLSPTSAVVGASGAIFGLFGALFVIQRSFGGANTQLLIVLGLNLVMGFIVPGISWQAHIGGLITGAIVANIMVRTRGEEPRRQRQGLGLVGLGLVALTVLGVLV
jgi:membrane associated rhomboid family serine protease